MEQESEENAAFLGGSSLHSQVFLYKIAPGLVDMK